MLVSGATTVFAELQSDLDRIWRAPAAVKQSGIWNLLRTRLLSFGITVPDKQWVFGLHSMPPDEQVLIAPAPVGVLAGSAGVSAATLPCSPLLASRSAQVPPGLGSASSSCSTNAADITYSSMAGPNKSQHTPRTYLATSGVPSPLKPGSDLTMSHHRCKSSPFHVLRTSGATFRSLVLRASAKGSIRLLKSRPSRTGPDTSPSRNATDRRASAPISAVDWHAAPRATTRAARCPSSRACLRAAPD